MKGTRQPITITCTFGPRTVDALVYGGLAIHRTILTKQFTDERFTITHVPTGRVVVGFLRNRQHAVAVVRRLQALRVPWRSADREVLRSHGPRVKRALTRMGVFTW